MKIVNYTTATPKLSDKLIGTSTGGNPSNPTENFIIEDILSLPVSTSKVLGFQRIDDSQFTDISPLEITDGNTATVLTNNGLKYSLLVGSNSFFDGNGRINPEKENDVYQLSVVFNIISDNTNNGHIDLYIGGPNGDYERIKKTITFAKGNGDVQNIYESFSFYADADFIQQGAKIYVDSFGSNVKIFDIIFFINRVQIG